MMPTFVRPPSHDLFRSELCGSLGVEVRAYEQLVSTQSLRSLLADESAADDADLRETSQPRSISQRAVWLARRRGPRIRAVGEHPEPPHASGRRVRSR